MKKRDGSKNKVKRILRRKKILRRIAKLHGAVTAGFLLIYILTALFTDPRFLIRDFQDKYARAAETTFSLRIMGPPGKPAVTADPNCSVTKPYADLDWDATEDTDNYDIYRDSLLLVTDLTDTEYQDDTVANATTYTYQVIANGPLGSTASDEVQATTSNCSANIPATCTIRTINGKNASNPKDIPEVKDQTPTFSGTTNIAGANISLTLYSDKIIGSTTANANGYWSWTVPEKLDYGNHYLTVTATDPDNPSYYTTTFSSFKVIKEEEKEKEREKEKNKKNVSVSPVTKPPSGSGQGETASPPEEAKPPGGNISAAFPLELSLKITSADKVAYAGKDLDIALIINHREETEKNLEITYMVLGSQNQILARETKKVTSNKDEVINDKIEIPKLVAPGKYKIAAKTNYGDFIVSIEEFLDVREVPLVNLGGGFVITPSQIMRKMGWVAFMLLFVLLFFLALLGSEHHLTRRALLHISENVLQQKNIFSGKKGVSG